VEVQAADGERHPVLQLELVRRVEILGRRRGRREQRHCDRRRYEPAEPVHAFASPPKYAASDKPNSTENAIPYTTAAGSPSTASAIAIAIRIPISATARVIRPNATNPAAARLSLPSSRRRSRKPIPCHA